MHPAEPESGQLVVWRVLGFGGRPNPLVFGRLTSILMRAAQATLTSATDRTDDVEHSPRGLPEFAAATSRLHLYVDDAAALFAGAVPATEECFDLLLLLWLTLGAPIAWPKVVLTCLDGAPAPCRWIGVDYDLTPDGARMRLPAEFVAELLAQLDHLLARGGSLSDSEVHQLCGRAGRVAYVVPAATPFASAIRAALEDSRRVGRDRRRAGQRGWHASSRFRVAAQWFAAVLRGTPLPGAGTLELERLILPGGPPRLVAGQCWAVVFDASPWGGGAVLYHGQKPVEYMATAWSDALCQRLQVSRGESRCLACFEALVALSAIEKWCCQGLLREVALVGDNLAALSVAISLRGKGDLAQVCREVALRQAWYGLHVAVGHLPTELNTIADALSRLFAPQAAALPVQLGKARVRDWPGIQELLRLSG